MVVSIVLDTEYMGVSERNKWFLKVVSNAMKEDTLIVTHSYFKDHLKEVVEGCENRFYDEFEMDRVLVEDINKLDICYIPDEWFDTIYEEAGSRSKQLIYLYNNNVYKIEKYIELCIDNALEKRKELKPDFIFNSLHVFEFVRAISSHYDCPIIPWVFSAIRKVHGYSQTLYMAHIDDNLFNSKACETMLSCAKSQDLGYQLLSKKEIIALLGKRHNMVLLPLLSREGIYDVGVVGEGYHITPEIYQHDNVTDDDLYYECKKLFESGSIITRQHPMQLDKIGIGRKHMKNDPAAFILSSKRVITVQSQMIVKAALWNRAPVVMGNALPYSCLLNKNLEDAIPINDYKMNFLLFAYFVPNTCMFSTEYWKWRMNNPSITDIIARHLDSILCNLSIPKSILQSKEDRIEKILQHRGFGTDEIESILTERNADDVPFDYPTSCLRSVDSKGNTKSLYALNHKNNGTIHSTFQLPADTLNCEFIPQFDLDGYITVQSIKIANEEIPVVKYEHYYNKNECVISNNINQKQSCQFEAKWTVRSYDS
ncbi:MAG: hypothetical protein IJR15_06440 [Clostridiales bacterium]|nr:hypothetical protein [Clostridiales bacterium]